MCVGKGYDQGRASFRMVPKDVVKYYLPYMSFGPKGVESEKTVNDHPYVALVRCGLNFEGFDDDILHLLSKFPNA